MSSVSLTLLCSAPHDQCFQEEKPKDAPSPPPAENGNGGGPLPSGSRYIQVSPTHSAMRGLRFSAQSYLNFDTPALIYLNIFFLLEWTYCLIVSCLLRECWYMPYRDGEFPCERMMEDLSLGRRKGVDDFEAISAWFVSSSMFSSNVLF
jgi:hypothetical protein